MATITPIFKLKDLKAEKPTLIYLKLYYNKDRFVYSTGLSIHPELWNKQTGRPYLKNSDEGLTVKMTRIETTQADTINKELAKYVDQTAQIINQLSIEHTIPTNDTLKAKYDGIFRPTAPEKKSTAPEKINLNQYIEQFIQDIKTGKRTTENGTRYSTGTIKNYLGFQSMFNEFQLDPRDRQTPEERKKRKDNKPKEPKFRKNNFDFQDITIDFYDKYVSFFNSMNYSPNTVGRHIKGLKVIMRAAKEDKLTDNKDIDRKKFKVITTEVHPVYLTQLEVETLNNLDLSENKPLDIARDIFLIGCYTAQRFSDYSRINSQHLKEVKGGKFIELIQEKTGERVTIPVRPELENILKKYNYNPPRTFDQKLNERIKTVCAKAEINEQIEVEEIKGGLKVTQRKPKHELIKTHTARRTGATLMFLAGIPSISIMKVTGHRTEREFLKYIRITKEENAMLLMNHPYFMGTPLKLVK